MRGRKISMRTSGRAICVALVSAFSLTVAASALAWRSPTASERSAITSAALRTPTAAHEKVHVSRIRVSTAGPWASASVAVYFGKQPDYATDILHKVHGKWRVASTGTAGEGCVMPRKDQQSLGLLGYPCRHSTITKARVGLPRPIYFWSNLPVAINKQNPMVIRPKTFLLFEDGQWVLQGMHWTGWGSSVAHGTGISSSSNGIPNAAQGKRIKTWARVTLSNPGRFQGHEVYRCFSLAVPPPANYGPQPLCLARSGGAWVLKSKARSLSSFLSPDRKVWCGMGSAQSFCVTGGGGTSGGNPPQTGATLFSDGKVTLCSVPVPSVSQGCTQNWDPAAPVLKVGQETELDGVLCKSEADGITCVRAAGAGTGKGFLISATTVRRV
jgi:hypothetical protein